MLDGTLLGVGLDFDHHAITASIPLISGVLPRPDSLRTMILRPLNCRSFKIDFFLGFFLSSSIATLSGDVNTEGGTSLSTEQVN